MSPVDADKSMLNRLIKSPFGGSFSFGVLCLVLGDNNSAMQGTE